MNNETSDKDNIKNEISKLLLLSDEQLKGYLAKIKHPADLKDIFQNLPLEQQLNFFQLIDSYETKSHLVSILDIEHKDELLKALSVEEIATWLDYLESDDAAELLRQLPKAKQTIVLEKLPNKSQQQIKQVLFYPEDTAGGIMQVECAKVSINATIADAIATVRRLVEQDVEILAVWVVRDDNFLLGSIPLADLLLQKANVPVKKVLEPIIASATPLIDQENVADLFKKYDLITLPVVNSKNQLLGRIVIDDIIDVVAEEAEEDALHMGGTSVEELHHTTQPFTTAKIRFPWLLVTLLFSFISTSIVALFGPLIEKAVIISVFYPLITAMGGNVGTQSATTLIRAIATNRIKITDIPMYFIKEIGVGVLLGVTCGVGAGLFAAIILSNGNYALGLVVLISMTLSMTAAACMGVIAPTLLRKFNIDPAIASGPFVTTLIDIIGILIYMLTAFYFIDYL